MRLFTQRRIQLALSLILVIQNPLSAQGFFDKVKETVSGAVKTATKITTAPYESVINTAKAVGGGNPKDIYKPYTKASEQAGKTVGSGITVVSEPQQLFYAEADKFASQFGDETEFIFDTSTFVLRYGNEYATAGGQVVANVLQGKNPLQLRALPLAAAVRAAREKFKNKALPIPQELKNYLRGILPDETIKRAKYAVGKVEITLPNIVNNIAIRNNANHAVTVDDIIVFFRTPKSFSEDPCWWIHEMIHVDQYRKWGIEEFAWKWVNDYPIEKKANEQGSRIANMSCNNGNETWGGFAGGYSSPNFSPQLKSSAPNPTTAAPILLDRFVAQCHFANNPYPYYYMITSTNKIIAVHMQNGSRVHIGNAAIPFNRSFAWDFALFNNFRVGVTMDGRIWEPVHLRNRWGQFLYNPNGTPMLGSNAIGYVRRL